MAKKKQRISRILSSSRNHYHIIRGIKVPSFFAWTLLGLEVGLALVFIVLANQQWQSSETMAAGTILGGLVVTTLGFNWIFAMMSFLAFASFFGLLVQPGKALR